MWGGWALELGRRWTARRGGRSPATSSRRSASTRSSGRVRAGAPLAVATMAEIAEIVAAVIRRWCPSVAAARRAVETAWFEPDPVAPAVPTADLAALFGRLRASGRRIAVATTDDRAPDRGDAARASASADHVVGARLRRRRGRREAGPGDGPRDLRGAAGRARADRRRRRHAGRPAMGRAAGAGRVIGVLTGVGGRGGARAARRRRPRLDRGAAGA